LTEELRHRARRLDKAADKIVSLHQSQDNTTQEEPLDAKRQARVDALRKEAARTREFVATHAPRLNRKGQELKTNVTDPDSAKMATSKGVIQGYAAQAAVDSAHQVIVAADVVGSGSEQSMLLPMIEQTEPYRAPHTLITADAGYHSDTNVAQLMEQAIPALIADNQMRQRDERFEGQSKHKAKDDVLYEKQPTVQGEHASRPVKLFKPQDFRFNDDNKTCICPAGQTLHSPGSIYTTRSGLRYQVFSAKAADCQACSLRAQCLKSQTSEKGKQVSRFEPRAQDPHNPSERMRCAIDSARGRHMYSQRLGTVEPVFGNIRHNKRLTRLNLRGREKVNAQWHLYCMVHNIEKLANSGWRQ
jgi:IS5 family transposase